MITPLKKLGELGSEPVHKCVLSSKTGVRVKDDIETCYFHEGFTKKSSTKTCKKHHQMISYKF